MCLKSDFYKAECMFRLSQAPGYFFAIKIYSPGQKLKYLPAAQKCYFASPNKLLRWLGALQDF
jgi:hypothetical protein